MGVGGVLYKMSKIFPPPVQQRMTDSQGSTSLSWIEFFNTLFTGDTGTSWIPEFTGLTETGGDADITGVYYKLSQNLTYFTIKIEPVTSTTAVTGTTYCNFPLNINSDGVCAVTFDNIAGVGAVKASNGRLYPVGWTAVTTPVTISGTIVAR